MGKREQLVQAGLELFKEHGYENTTLNMILDKVGVAKNSFYYYFKSKEELLKAAMASQKTFGMADLATVLMSDQPCFLQYWEIQKPKIDFALSCGSEIMKNLMLIQAKDEASEEMKKIEESLLEKAKEAGEIKNSSSAQALCAIGATSFLGIIALWVSSGGGFDLEKAVRSALEACFDVKDELRLGKGLNEIL
ncbi:MAG: TetR/AcrR family transcriptional regulator [Clostridiales bacterium]|jgi:AcrR family transcriptional regulator|nr:TetR/AcrR family transcriptional regulator [Clostridiales bacterium]MDR2752025.1 TetR/AcrR family transcriptional regulator [Clostridiales bacterium]